MIESYERLEVNRCFARWFAAIPKSARAAFFGTLIGGLLVHLYMFMGKYPNHDEMLCLFLHGDLAESGRWMLRLFGDIGSNFSMPWVNGLLTLLTMAGAVAVLVSLLRIDSPFVSALFGAAFIAFPSIGNTFAFMFTADAYGFVFLLMMIALYFVDNKKWGFFIGIPLLVVVLASYQPYLAFAIAILALRGFQLLITGALSDREVWIKVGKYAGFLIGGVGLYLVSTKIVLSIIDIPLSGYNSVDTMGQIEITRLPRMIWDAYYTFFEFLFVQSGKYSSLGLSIAHLVMGLAVIALFILLLRADAFRSKGQKLFAIVIFLLTPLTLNAGHLMGAHSVHIMMMGQIVLLYVLGFVELDALMGLKRAETRQAAPSDDRAAAPAEVPRGLVVGLAYLLSALVLYCTVCWSVYTNQNYLAMQLKYENIYALTNRVVERIEEDENYVPGMPVAFIGDVASGNYPYSKGPEFGDLDYGVGFGGAKEYEYIYDDYHFKHFCRYYLGVYYEYLDADALSIIEADPAFSEMPYYPAAGSVRLIGGVLVVRMGGDRI